MGLTKQEYSLLTKIANQSDKTKQELEKMKREDVETLWSIVSDLQNDLKHTLPKEVFNKNSYDVQFDEKDTMLEQIKQSTFQQEFKKLVNKFGVKNCVIAYSEH